MYERMMGIYIEQLYIHAAAYEQLAFVRYMVHSNMVIGTET